MIRKEYPEKQKGRNERRKKTKKRNERRIKENGGVQTEQWNEHLPK
jgi:hypothetical protein